MLRALVTSVLFAVVVDFASVSPAVAQDARSQAIMACNAEGFGVHGARAGGGGSADAARAAMRACVQRKMAQQKKKK
jgi:hypothetical protein